MRVLAVLVAVLVVVLVAGSVAAQPGERWFILDDDHRSCAESPVAPGRYVQVSRTLHRAHPVVREWRTPAGHLVVLVIDAEGSWWFFETRVDCERHHRLVR